MPHAIRSENWPPFPQIPQDALHQGITTRVMATKQISQMRKNSDNCSESLKSIQFLTGVAIPNSTIRSLLDQDVKSQISDDSKLPSQTSDKTVLEEQIEEINNRLSEERGLERIRQKIRSSTIEKALASAHSREKSQSKLKTFNLRLPIRRSTVESIKKAIDKFPDNKTQLLNVDSFEKKKLYQHFKTSQTDQLIVSKKKSPNQSLVKKQDLQTQTSLVLEKLLAHMGQENKRSK